MAKPDILAMLLQSLSVLVAFLVGVSLSCPEPESIAPLCTCREFGEEFMMTCEGVTSAEELIPPIQSTGHLDMFSLAIVDSSLLYLPSRLFTGTRFQKVMLLNSQLLSLSDSSLAFEGLENRLEEIRASGAHYVTTWDWSQLGKQQKLKLIDVHLISMYALDQEFPRLDSLTHLGISRAEISSLHPTAFRQLQGLKLLVLKDNEIQEMSREMLPSPAPQLHTIELSGNQISSLPEDMFSAMPSLEQLDLNNNRLVTLNEDTFRWPFENLQSIRLADNPFRCDCRLRWIVDVRKPTDLDGACAQPDNLRNSPLKYLTNNVLWC